MISKSAWIFALAFLLSRVAAAGSTTVPLQLLGNFPVITAQIDGIDVPLVFDLPDESAVALAQTVIDRVKTSPAGETHRAQDPMGNVIQSGTFKLSQLKVGNIVFTDVIGRPDLHDPAYQSANIGQQGFLGTALLKSYKVILDYAHRQFTLISQDSTKDELQKCKGVSVLFLPDWNGTPVTQAVTDFGVMTAIWDTGSPVSILRRANAQQLSDSVINETATTQHLVLGGADFGPLTLDVADYVQPAGSDMFIGYSFFINHVVCVDFPGRRFLIQHSLKL